MNYPYNTLYVYFKLEICLLPSKCKFNLHGYTDDPNICKPFTSRSGYYKYPTHLATQISKCLCKCFASCSIIGEILKSLTTITVLRLDSVVGRKPATALLFNPTVSTLQKFYLRCLKNGGSVAYTCPKTQECVISKETRSHCQYCRYKKCLALGMYKPGSLAS